MSLNLDHSHPYATVTTIKKSLVQSKVLDFYHEDSIDIQLYDWLTRCEEEHERIDKFINIQDIIDKISKLGIKTNASIFLIGILLIETENDLEIDEYYIDIWNHELKHFAQDPVGKLLANHYGYSSDPYPEQHFHYLYPDNQTQAEEAYIAYLLTK